MKKISLSLLLLSAVFVLAACSTKSSQVVNDQTPIQTNAPADSAIPTEPTTNTAFFTLADVAKHNSPSDCWLAVDGNVFDVTAYVKAGLHPGGEAILKGCGLDASQMFAQVKKHGDKARGMLDSYFIGKLQ
ncbi:MAG: cytochrome b5 domain-containing protein [Patescibacteria group bacterium]